MADTLTVGHAFDGVSGLQTTAHLEDLMALAEFAASSPLLDQATLEDFDNGGVRCARVKAGAIANAKLAAGAVVPAKIGGILAFHAHKNGSDQTLYAEVVPTYKVSFSTEEFDIGGCFAVHQWVPSVAGICVMRGQFGMSLTSGKYAAPVIYKNGAAWKRGRRVLSHSTGEVTLGVSAQGYANGTDYFELYVDSDEQLPFAVLGDEDVTFFEGCFVTTYTP